jgi:dethiobiotin synthetase
VRGVFVVGTDTGVGKTLACAALMAAAPPALRYWKPVQTGLVEDDDTATVRRVARLGADRVVDDGVRLMAPASPHHAAALEGQTITLAPLLALAARLDGPTLVEGAGGLLVPLSPTLLLPELIAALGLPVLLVASTRLGAINHTLLTVAELRRRGLELLALALSGSPDPSLTSALAAHAPELSIRALLPTDSEDFDALRAAGRDLLADDRLAAQLGRD